MIRSQRMTQNDGQHLKQEHHRYKQQGFIIFHYFHTRALVASLKTALASCPQLFATFYFSQTRFPEQRILGDNLKQQ